MSHKSRYMSIVITLFAMALLFTGYNTQIKLPTKEQPAFSSETRDISINTLAGESQQLMQNGFPQKEAIQLASENIQTRLSALTLSDKLYPQLSTNKIKDTLAKFDRNLLERNFEEISSNITDNIRLGIVTDILLNTALKSPKLQLAVESIFKDKSFNVAYIKLSPSTLNIKPTNKQINDYFSRNKHRYQNPPRVSLHYIIVDTDKLPTTQPTEAVLKSYFNDNKKTFTKALTKTVELKTTTKDVQMMKLPAKIDKLLDELKHNTNKESINLTTSNVSLPTLPAHVQKSLQANGHTHWTPTDDNNYVLYYQDAPNDITFTQIKDTVRKQYIDSERKKFAQNLFIEINELAYTSPESLSPISEKYNLPIRETKLFSPHLKQEIPRPFTEKSLAALKQDDIENKNYNSDAVRLNDKQFAVYRIKQNTPASQMTLEQAKNEITRTLSSQLSEEKILKATKLENINTIANFLKKPITHENRIVINDKIKRNIYEIILACADKKLCTINRDGFTYIAATTLKNDKNSDHKIISLDQSTAIAFTKDMSTNTDIKINPSIISFIQQ